MTNGSVSLGIVCEKEGVCEELGSSMGDWKAVAGGSPDKENTHAERVWECGVLLRGPVCIKE